MALIVSIRIQQITIGEHVMFKNNPNLAGQPAHKKLFSECYRFALFPVHTMFEVCEWFITDAYIVDPITGKADVVFQGNAADALARFESLKLIDGE
jgi:hypothetical protein